MMGKTPLNSWAGFWLALSAIEIVVGLASLLAGIALVILAVKL